MRRLVSKRPIDLVARSVALGAVAGLACGLADVIVDYVKHGVSEKSGGAVVQLGVIAPIYVAFVVVVGMTIGLAFGTALTVIRAVYVTRLHKEQAGKDAISPQTHGGSPFRDADH